MKKLFACVLVFAAMATAGFCAYAAEETLGFQEATPLPTTYIRDAAALLSEEISLEQVLMNGWENLEEGIDVSAYGLSKEEFRDAYWQTIYDNPLYFYVDTSYRYMPMGDRVIKVLPVYTETDPEKIAALRSEIDRATEEILFYINDNMTDFEKVMAVHDYMVLHYTYDESLTNHTISIMTTKTGVCMSYAFAFTHLMNTLGIECTYVSSEAMNHAWNLVKLDDEWYHIDLTWDDPVHDAYGQVHHEFALLSSEEISSKEEPHYGFDLHGLEATSSKYDKAPWHDSVGSVVHADGKTYWFDGDDLECSDGTTVFEDIVENNRWILGNYYLQGIYAGLAEYNGKLYFNSPDTIYVYDPATKTTEKFRSVSGACGLYIDNNVLYYTKYDRENRGFCEGGSINLGGIRLGESYYQGDQIVTKVYKDDDAPMMVFSFSGKGLDASCVEGKGLATVTLDAGGTAQLFFWTKDMQPLRPKLTITE